MKSATQASCRKRNLRGNDVLVFPGREVVVAHQSFIGEDVLVNAEQPLTVNLVAEVDAADAVVLDVLIDVVQVFDGKAITMRFEQLQQRLERGLGFRSAESCRTW